MAPARWLPLLAAVAIASCAAPRRPPAASAAPSRAAAQETEGQYRGIARLTRASIRGCPRSGGRTVIVEGNALSVPYRGATASHPLAATIGPDGSIHGSDGQGTVEGQITGRHMDLTVSSDDCELRYALDRS